jgi:di/tricarboxylate transporter
MEKVFWPDALFVTMLAISMIKNMFFFMKNIFFKNQIKMMRSNLPAEITWQKESESKSGDNRRATKGIGSVV